MDLKTALELVLSPDPGQQKAAERALADSLGSDFVPTIARLTEFAKTSDVSDTVRQSAAMAFKNALTSKDANEKLRKQQTWISVPNDAKDFVKRNLLETLQTDKPGLGRAVAQCVTAVALCGNVAVEWPDLIPTLSRLVMEQKNISKQSSLEAIGYICEEITTDALSPYSGTIVSAIMNGMNKDEPSIEVRLAAATAFQNAMDFFKEHFARPEERDYMMTVTCEATQASDARMKTAALQCMVRIVQLYYSCMEPYMTTALLPISCQAMTSTDSDEVVLQGMEFWSSLCDLEIDLKLEIEDGIQGNLVYFGFVQKNLSLVTPYLLQWLTRQPDNDEEEWMPSKAAHVCLTLLAECVEDEIAPAVVPYIVQNIQNPDWHHRDAACVAFGCILDGPDPKKLMPMVDEAYDVVMSMMADESMAVRDSAAWVIQRMCEFIGTGNTMRPDRFANTLQILRQNLGSAPGVALNVCWALTTLARTSYESASMTPGGQVQTTRIPASTALSSVFPDLINDLFQAGFRGDSMHNNLRTAAFEAVNQLMQHSPQDCYPAVQKTAVQIYQHIAGALSQDSTMDAAKRTHYGDYCQHWLVILNTILKRLEPADRAQIRATVYDICTRTLDLYRNQHSFQAEPEALHCLTTLMDLDPTEFSACLDGLHPYITLALTSYNEHTIVNAALSLVSGICHNYESTVIRFVPTFVEHVIRLISQLNDPSGLVKPRAVCTLGDIALSMGSLYAPYAVMSFECLRSIAVPQDVDVWMSLVEAILEACVGLVNCLETQRDGIKAVYTDGVRTMMRAYASFIIPLIVSAAEQLPLISDGCVQNCAIMMSTLCQMFGREMLPLVDKQEFFNLLQKGKAQKGTKTKTLCSITLKELQKLKMSTGAGDAVSR